jgi:tRNA-Thr(GGU) m(6)t(6)A37 methyltransferase TsaA
MNNFIFNQIGVIHSCYKEKFCIPRQPGLVKTPGARLELFHPYNRKESLAGLEQYSHIWIVFVFHKSQLQAWKPVVRPPRFGGNKKTGVFATRSPFRPNPLGISAVEYKGHTQENGRLFLELDGIDLLDRTPVVDIKPYLPYSDLKQEAIAVESGLPPVRKFDVVFAEGVLQVCKKIEKEQNIHLADFITELLSYDPRPAYTSSAKKNDPLRVYGTKIMDYDLQWQIEDNVVTVVAI